MSDVLSAEEIEALLGALSKGDISFDGGGNDCKNGDMNFRRDPFTKFKGTLKQDLPPEEQIQELEKQKRDIEEEIGRICEANPACPQCNMRFRRNSYSFSCRNETYKEPNCEKDTWKYYNKKIIYVTCPRNHTIRLGEVNDFGYKEDEVLSQKQIDELFSRLSEIDYNYME